MAQAIDAVAHDEPHGAGIVIRPHRLGAVALFGAQERLRGDVESIIPRDRDELAAALVALATQRREQTILMVHPLGITRDLGADHAGCVIVVRCAVNAADGVGIDDLHVERAGGRTVMRARGRTDPNSGAGIPHRLVHGAMASSPQNPLLAEGTGFDSAPLFAWTKYSPMRTTKIAPSIPQA